MSDMSDSVRSLYFSARLVLVLWTTRTDTFVCYIIENENKHGKQLLLLLLGVVHWVLCVCCVYLQVRFNLLQYIVPEVKELYNWLEMDFHPLKLSGRVTKVTFEFREVTMSQHWAIWLATVQNRYKIHTNIIPLKLQLFVSWLIHLPFVFLHLWYWPSS